MLIDSNVFFFYFKEACLTGVFCNDRLVDEHIDVVILADSQCCTKVNELIN